MFYRVMRILAYPFVRILYRFRISGKENIPKKGKIILCCNHISYADVALLIISCPRRISFMAKEELFRNPIAGWFFRRMGAFPVRRGSGGKEAVERAISLLNADGMLGIFPEGKRCREGHPTRAKSGIALILSQVNAPVIPAAVEYFGKRRIFTRAGVRFGEPIPHEKLEMNGSSHEELRRVSTEIMDSITNEWKKLNG